MERFWRLFTNIVAAAILFVIASSAGCSVGPAPPIDDVTGRYTMQFSEGTEVLVLKGDGTYDETFTFPDSRVATNNGTWTREIGSRPTRIHVKQAIIKTELGEVVLLDYTFRVVRIIGGVELQADPDPDGAFVLDRMDEAKRN